jgi:hypothetical protein
VKAPSQSKRVPLKVVEQIQMMLEQLPDKAGATTNVETIAPKLSRIDYYLKHLQGSYAYLPAGLKYWAVDGFYSKKKFVDGVVGLNLHMISKLRSDADMRYLYTGVQKPRGAKRKYDGKVDLSDLSRLFHVKQLEPQLNLYTLIVWHVSALLHEEGLRRVGTW